MIVWEKGRNVVGSGDDAGVLKRGDSAEQHPSEEGGVEVVNLWLQDGV